MKTGWFVSTVTPRKWKKTPSHQNFYKFCTTPGTYCSEYEPKSLYWSMGCTGSLFIHRGWRLAGLFRLWRHGNEKKTPSHQNFYKFCTTPGTYCSEYDPKSLYWSTGCTSSLLIHRGWRLAGLFRLWCPGNEKKKDSFAPEFLQVLHHALDVLFRVRTKKPLLFDGLHRFIVYT